MALSDGLALLWHLNNSTDDDSLSANVHNGTLNGATFDGTTKQLGSHSLATDGADDYIYTANHSDFALGSNDFTVGGWYYLDEAMGSVRMMVGYGGGAEAFNATTGIQYYGYIATAGKLFFSYYNGSGGTTVSSPSAVDLTAGFHLVLWKNNATNFRMLVDDTEVFSGSSITIAGTSAPDKFIVGENPALTSAWSWKGWADEIGVWPNKDLSSAEESEWWNGGAGVELSPGGFIPYPNPRYSMNGGMQQMGGGN